MMSESASLYDTDFVAWTEQAAAAVRNGDLTEELRAQIAEEIVDMGKRDYREARSRLKVLLVHVLKCLYQPERAGRSWYATISTQRSDLNALLKQSPSLRRWLDEEYGAIYLDARYDASAETGLVVEMFPAQPPVGLETALSPAYLPGAIPGV